MDAYRSTQGFEPSRSLESYILVRSENSGLHDRRRNKACSRAGDLAGLRRHCAPYWVMFRLCRCRMRASKCFVSRPCTFETPEVLFEMQ
jgi:hypothetical protein